MSNLPELLAPAGSMESLQAALEAGADAVYFGGAAYSCRMRAKNFTGDQLKEALRLCREYRVRSYLTVNAKLFDNELKDALLFVSDLWEGGADALILSDIGLAAQIHREFPDFELHASTQFSSASSLDARVLRDVGFSRVVCPREFSLKQIQQLCNASPVEIEMFIHGAHCVSFSGQCMMSYALGGRSGNRGECAQPCRLPYTVEGHRSAGEYPLSLKDMSLAGHVEEILSSGVSSLKIEGRQKPADYVYRVTSVWRRLLDERRNATPEEMEELASAFSRQGFTDGYFRRRYSHMGGIRGEKPEDTVSPFEGLKRRIPLQLSFSASAGRPSVLTVSDGIRSATVEGAVPDKAEKHPLSVESVKESLCRLGGSAFTAADFTARLEEGLWLTKAQLNQLRREAIQQMIRPETVRVSPPISLSRPAVAGRQTHTRRIGEFLTSSQIPAEAYLFFDEIRLPISESDSSTVPILPAVVTDAMLPQITEFLRSLTPGTRVVVHNFGLLQQARSFGLLPIASYRFTVFNSFSADFLLAQGAACVELSPELSASAVRSFRGPKAFMVYGRLPLMLTFRCAISGGGDVCSMHGAGGFCENAPVSHCRDELIDRTGARFPMVSDHCRTVIYNSVPTFMGDKKEEIDSLHLEEEIYRFTTETKEEVDAILQKYKKGLPLGSPIRRIH